MASEATCLSDEFMIDCQFCLHSAPPSSVYYATHLKPIGKVVSVRQDMVLGERLVFTSFPDY
jgi:hypothetical protein